MPETTARTPRSTAAPPAASAAAPDVPQDMRERILDAATRLFASRGFEGASLAAIAGEVGVRKPSLLYHFKSKDDLRAGVLDALLDRWKDILPQLMLAASSGLDRFDRVVGEVVAFFRADPARARLLLRELLDRPDETRALLTERVSPWIDMVARYIRAGQREGTVRADVDPEAYLHTVVLSILSVLACSDAVAVFVSDDGADPLSRPIAELGRAARAALFTDPAPA